MKYELILCFGFSRSMLPYLPPEAEYHQRSFALTLDRPLPYAVDIDLFRLATTIEQRRVANDWFVINNSDEEKCDNTQFCPVTNTVRWFWFWEPGGSEMSDEDSRVIVEMLNSLQQHGFREVPGDYPNNSPLAPHLPTPPADGVQS